jgi:cupin fold WbuC family metalloprotein
MRTALAPPAGDLVVITRALVDEAVAGSRVSPRRRMILPFHKQETDALHRMLNAVQPDSYIRPHRHREPPKTESWVLIQGALAFFTFEEDGRVRELVRLEPGGAALGVDLAPGIYHTFVATAPDTVVYEVKTGPYAPADDKAFAPWAPPEGDPSAPEYLRVLRSRI